MDKRRNFLWLILMLQLMFSSLSAGNIIGGELRYQSIPTVQNPNQYMVWLVVISEAGSSMDDSIKLNYASSCFPSGSSYLQFQPGGSGWPVPNHFECIAANDPQITQLRVYNRLIDFPNCGDWKLSIEQCCRINGISNVIQADTSSFYLEAFLNNNVGNSSSPVFTTFPLNSFCSNPPFKLSWRHAVNDPDLDSVHIRLDTVRGANGNRLTYTPGYSSQLPVKSSTPLLMDGTSGHLHFTPSHQETDILLITAEEFRFDSATQKKVKTGSTQRESVIWVADTCNPETVNNNFHQFPNQMGIKVNCRDSIFFLSSNIAIEPLTVAINASDFLIFNDEDTLELAYLEVIGHTDVTLKLILKKSVAENDTFYMVTRVGTDGNGIHNQCGYPISAMDSLMFIVQNCSGGSAVDFFHTVAPEVYPNPATDHLFLETTGNFHPMRFSIYDLNGRKLLQNLQVNSKRTIIDISSLSKGMYYLKPDEGHWKYIPKFFKE